MIAECRKCRALFEGLETSPATTCARCAAVDELLVAADALNAEVRRYLTREKSMHPEAEFFVEPLLDRSERAVAIARAA